MTSDDPLAEQLRQAQLACIVRRDYRDLALEDAVHELMLLEDDVAVYRELLVASFDALHDLTLRYQRVRADRDRLAQACRHLREETLLATGADA